MRIIPAVVMFLAAARMAPAQQTPQEKWKSSYAQIVRFRQDAKAAFDREVAREKAGDCPNALTTLAMVDCLAKENGETMANYGAYVDALRSLFRVTGSDGVDLVTAFDAAETAWKKYCEAQCQAARAQYQGGTGAGPAAGFCQLMLVRNHMREMDKIYYDRLNN